MVLLSNAGVPTYVPSRKRKSRLIVGLKWDAETGAPLSTLFAQVALFAASLCLKKTRLCSEHDHSGIKTAILYHICAVQLCYTYRLNRLRFFRRRCGIKFWLDENWLEPDMRLKHDDFLGRTYRHWTLRDLFLTPVIQGIDVLLVAGFYVVWASALLSTNCLNSESCASCPAMEKLKCGAIYGLWLSPAYIHRAYSLFQVEFWVLWPKTMRFMKAMKAIPRETAMSRWLRAVTGAAKLGKGLSKDEKARKLALQHWLEAIDPRHRYGHNLHFYYDIWFESRSTQPFFYWLDVGDGRELNLEKCSRINLQRQCIIYLGPKEREAYEVIVESGRLVYKQTGIPLNTVEGSKWIFVLSTSRALYVGQKKKRVFEHSSFLSGGATTAAGRLVAHQGVLEAIWPYSGHYLPTEDNFKEFITFLEVNNVELSNVKRCSIYDDEGSFKVTVDGSKQEETKNMSTIATSTSKKEVDANVSIHDECIGPDHEQSSIAGNAVNAEPPPFNVGKLLSLKWTSGDGPRIGCVRDYPADLQTRALEQVNLSPRSSPGNFGSSDPIPSPRPSPKIPSLTQVCIHGTS
ncbi:hypothetical protein SLE2022_148450 [Rubroshorea leprosula]